MHSSGVCFPSLIWHTTHWIVFHWIWYTYIVILLYTLSQTCNFLLSYNWAVHKEHFKLNLNLQSVQRWAMGWTIGVLGFYSRRGLGIFLFTTASRTALGLTQPPIQWVRGALSLGAKWPGHEADNSPPSSPEVKNAWSYTSTPLYVFMAWCLVKHWEKFTFYLYS
jgi:hypothetical protein